MKKAIRIFILCLTCFFLLLNLAGNAAASTKVEVVSTIPVETTLKPQGTRSAAAVWLQMVKKAKKSLDFAEFYLSNKDGQPLEPVIDAVIDAAKRGLKVRFLVGTPANDGMKENTDAVLKRFEGNSNITVTTFDWKQLSGGILHAKYFIVDRSEAYVGSQNFDWRALKHIHETGLFINNKEFVKDLLNIFEIDWKFNNGDKNAYEKQQEPKAVHSNNKDEKKFADRLKAPLFLVASPEKYNPPGIPCALKTLITLIDDAQNKITVQLLNYSEYRYDSEKPFTDISDALTRAAQRGVKVQMLVSNWNKRHPGALQKLVQVSNIDIKFVNIPQSKEGFIPYSRVIHSKVMRIDKTISWVGTSNWGHRYFYGSRNIEAVTRIPSVSASLDRLFDQLWNSKYAEQVDPKKKYTPPKIN